MDLFKDRPRLYKNLFLFPEVVLSEQAKNCLFFLAARNDHGSYNTPYRISALQNGGHSCIVAEKGRLSINFESAMMRGILVDEVDTILDEVHRHDKSDWNEDEYLPSTTAIMNELSHESIVFLNYYVG